MNLIITLLLAHAHATFLLCQDELVDSRANTERILQQQIFDRPIPFSWRDDGVLSNAYDRLQIPLPLNNLFLSVWIPKRPGPNALNVSLLRFDRYKLTPVLRFGLPTRTPTHWRPLQVPDANAPYANILATRTPKPSHPSPLDFEYFGYRSEPDADGVRVVVQINHVTTSKTMNVRLGIDVPAENVARYAFPDMIERGEALRIKTPEGDYFRILMLTFNTEKL